jgi:pilus assembly protein CpaD
MIEKPRRIFSRSRRGRAAPVCAALAVAALAVLTGCSSESAYWSPAESQKQVKVDWVRFDHRVMFGQNSRGVTDQERARIDEFLDRVEPRYGDQILVGTGAGNGDGEIAAERVAAVTEYLRALGLKVGPMPAAAQARWDGAVRVMVGRYVVTPPNCPDWTKSASYDPSNQVSSNFGCATATNLGLMVADPGDLVRGRDMGPADGAYSARMIKTYREGDTKSSSSPAGQSMTINLGGSGGGGGASGGGASP